MSFNALQSLHSPLVGRNTELAQIESYLDEHHSIITLTGPPGMGKTSLAREITNRTSKALGDSTVFFGDLVSANTIDDITNVLITALDLRSSMSTTGKEIQQTIGHSIAAQNLHLVVLDNFEHLVEFAAQTLSIWSSLAQNTHFLVTSRTRLNLQAERCIDLAPMDTTFAVELFIDRAKRIRPDYSPKSDEQDVLKKLMNRLDGNPLAIELAAGRIGVVSPQQMLKRLDKRFELLTHGPHDSSPRQASLRVSIDGSWKLLPNPEKNLLKQSSIFSQSFSLADAEAVIRIQSKQTTLELLENLARHSLITTTTNLNDDELHFHLYESIRDYAYEKLTNKESLKRHAHYYLGLAEKHMVEFGLPESNNIAWFNENRGNLLAIIARFPRSELGLRGTLALAHSQMYYGPYDELLKLLQKAITFSLKLDLPLEKARLYLTLGVTQSMFGRTEAVQEALKNALNLSRENQLIATEVKTLIHLGLNSLQTGLLTDCLELLTHAVDLATRTGLDRLRARAIASLGIGLEHNGMFLKALDCYNEARVIANNLSDHWEEARCRVRIGTLYSVMKGQEERARKHLGWALTRSQYIADPVIEATASYSLGQLELNHGNHAMAEEHLSRALNTYRAMANRMSEGLVRLAMGLLHLDQSAFENANAELMLAQDNLSNIPHSQARIFTEITFALAALSEGLLKMAEAHAQQAIHEANQQDNSRLKGLAHCVLCITAHTMNNAALCKEHHKQAVECLKDTRWGEGSAMLAVTEAITETKENPTVKIPELNKNLSARARIAWRIIETNQTSLFLQQENKSPASTTLATNNSNTALIVHLEGMWFELPNQTRIDLGRKRMLRPLLLLLANERLTAPGKGLTVDAIFEHVWSQERALPNSRKNRVYVAIASLRKLGLSEYLTTRGDGYLFHPKRELIFSGKETVTS